MKNLTLCLGAMVALMLGHHEVHATGHWIDGQTSYVYGHACITGNSEIEVGAFTGYFGDPNALQPKVGNIAYIHAIGMYGGNQCSGQDLVGFEFFPPVGAQLAISAANPVLCYLHNISTGAYQQLACPQSPSIGQHGGLFFAAQYLGKGFGFEVQVPVKYTSAISSQPTSIWTSSVNGDVESATPVFVFAANAQPTALFSAAIPMTQAFDIPFTGTSVANKATNGSLKYMASHTIEVASLRDVRINVDGFLWYPTGYSTMQLDIVYYYDGIEEYRERLDKGEHPGGLILQNVPAGTHTLTLEMRGVLVSGPPITVYFRGDVNGTSAATWSAVEE